MKCYKPEVYFASEIKDNNKQEFMEIVSLNLMGVPPSGLQLQVSIVMPSLIPVLQEAA